MDVPRTLSQRERPEDTVGSEFSRSTPYSHQAAHDADQTSPPQRLQFTHLAPCIHIALVDLATNICDLG
eukprot:1838767-Amphidinium_carterae.1